MSRATTASLPPYACARRWSRRLAHTVCAELELIRLGVFFWTASFQLALDHERAGSSRPNEHDVRIEPVVAERALAPLLEAGHEGLEARRPLGGVEARGG